MRIIVDAFGGDNAPLEIMKGCALAVEEYGVQILLTGDEETIGKTAQENGISMKNISVLNAPRVMAVEDRPTSVIKENSDTSLAMGLKALSEGEGDAFVSAGSTGAITAGAALIVKRIKGIKRPAICFAMPTAKGTPSLLLDCGANSDCRAEMLHQFAVMGNIYMSEIFSVKEPRVALINIGTEDTKGDALRHEAFEVMKNSTSYNFVGNMEAREVFSGDYDVMVTDGFTGNMIIKSGEGMAKFILSGVKTAVNSGFKSKLGGLLLRKNLYGLKSKIDYKEYGGTIVIGVRKTVIKAHGSSDARAIKNSIRQAKECAERDIVNRIKNALERERSE